MADLHTRQHNDKQRQSPVASDTLPREVADPHTQKGGRNEDEGVGGGGGAAGAGLPFLAAATQQDDYPVLGLSRRSHISLRSDEQFSLGWAYPRRRPVARDWSFTQKRTVAAVACVGTALIGLLLGIYAGLVPSMQRYVDDTSHAVLMGNVYTFGGLAVSALFLWPLPLLHGRRPYVLVGLSLALLLAFPQAISVEEQRVGNKAAQWRATMLVSRALMGLALGLASMNFHSILTDLFGACLMREVPHQEAVYRLDPRRHGGGMGIWLGIWTWCWIGTIPLGFMIGAIIINFWPPVWGLYLGIVLILAVLIMSICTPETRRAASRLAVAEVRCDRTDQVVSRRLAHGELMLSRAGTAPRWWGDEVWQGVLLSLEMLRQPGFAVVSVYCGWVYAQVVLLVVVFGSLLSRSYRYRAPQVGILIATLTLGALFAVPFQKANLASNRAAFLARLIPIRQQHMRWTSHLMRRTVFTLILPLTVTVYASVSTGPPRGAAGPAMGAMAIGFLSCLAVAECNGMLMETFDTSDLRPGMTTARGEGNAGPINHSGFPRVTAAYAITHTFAYVFAAGATGLGGLATRTLGPEMTSWDLAIIMDLVTVLLVLVVVRFKSVRVVPRSRECEMERWAEARRRGMIGPGSELGMSPSPSASSIPLTATAAAEEVDCLRPVMLGNPVGVTRTCNILELGSMSRWTAIRKKNRLVDEENERHPNWRVEDAAAAMLGDHQASDFGRGGGEDNPFSTTVAEEFEMQRLQAPRDDGHGGARERSRWHEPVEGVDARG